MICALWALLACIGCSGFFRPILRPWSLTALGALNLPKAKELIKEKALLSAIVGQFVELKEMGPSQYTCLCPFHSDTNPSMNLNDDKGLYHCFACGAGGDVIEFVRDIEHLTFNEAVVKTLSLAGVSDISELETGNTVQSREDLEQLRRRNRMELALRLAVRFYSTKLLGDAKAGSARTHLIQRRIRPQTAYKFQIGYAPLGGPFSLTANLTAEGFTIDELVEAGLTIKGDPDRPRPGVTQKNNPNSKNDFDRFRDRLMVPICNAQGIVVGFGGRLLEGDPTPTKPKYLNSPESAIFKKSTTLFGFDFARKAIAADGMAVIVEGYFDVISLHDVGIENAVGSMGTMLTKEQLEAAARAAKGKVVLLFDADEAGQLATQRVIDKILPQVAKAANIPMDLRIASLPSIPKKKAGEEDPKDAADFCVRLGVAAGPAMKTALAQAVGWKQWSVDRIILMGLREVESQNREDKNPPSSSDDAQEEQNGSPLLSVLGIENAGSLSAASLASLAAAPDILAKTAGVVSRFLGTLDDSSDRTILAYYCAERLSVGRTGMRLQLETDILTGAKKHSEFLLSQRATKKTSPPSALGNSSLPSALSIKQQPLSKNAPTSTYTRKTDPPSAPAAASNPPLPHTTSHVVGTSFPKQTAGLASDNFRQQRSPGVSYSVPHQGIAAQAQQPQQQQRSQSGNSGILLGGEQFQIKIDTSTVKPYGAYQGRRVEEPERYWEEVRLPDDSKFVGQKPKSSKRRHGAESELLHAFLVAPSLRSQIRSADVRGGQRMWSNDGNFELWEIMCALEDRLGSSSTSSPSQGDFVAEVQKEATSENASLRLNEILITNGGQQIPPENIKGMEYRVANALNELRQACVILDSQNFNAVMERSSESEQSDDIDIVFREMIDQQCDIVRQQDRVVELTEAHSQTEKLAKKLSEFQRELQGREFYEQLDAHRNSNDGFSSHLEHDVEGDIAVNDKYMFNTDNCVLTAESVRDEEQRIQSEQEQERLKSIKAGPKKPGYTIGFDDDEPQPSSWKGSYNKK